MHAADDWLCAGYGLLERYIAIRTASGDKILAASLNFQPVAALHLYDFSIEAAGLSAGQRVTASLTKKRAEHKLRQAVAGRLSFDAAPAQLLLPGQKDYHSDLHVAGRWISDLNLWVRGSRVEEAAFLVTSGVDHSLRKASSPFDGLADLCSWLEFDLATITGGLAAISIRIGAPARLVFSPMALSSGILSLEVDALPRFNVRRLTVGLRHFPGQLAEMRSQVGHRLQWSTAVAGVKKGKTSIPLPSADRALAMLVVGGVTSQRQWFGDPAKAVNQRLLSMQVYDKDLKLLRASLLEPTDGRKFEQAIASLLFILGFTAVIPLETDAPDLIVATPGGQLLVVECTIRAPDFPTKLTKLIERRIALSSTLAQAEQTSRVHAALVCALPEERMNFDRSSVAKREVIAICHQQIVDALGEVNLPRNPDTALDELVRAMANTGTT